MKLVQLLAKELKEWPEGVVRAWQSGCDNEIYFDGANSEMFYTTQHADDSGYSGSRITRKQWQAEREKMNKPKWIWHRGGNQPVEDIVKVEYRMRDGDISTQPEYASTLRWSHWPNEGDIMAYRVIEETKDQEIEEVRKFSKDVDMNIGQGEIIHGPVSIGDTVITAAHPKFDTNLGTLTYKLEIDATGANKALDSLIAKWGQIESPLKWRDEIIELEAYEEEFRREREKLIRKLESEGFKLIDHVPAKCLRDEWEAMDYESFCVGDTVVCINEKPDDTVAELTIGKEYRLTLDNEELCVIDDAGDAMRYCIEIGCFKLVKRA